MCELDDILYLSERTSSDSSSTETGSFYNFYLFAKSYWESLSFEWGFCGIGTRMSTGFFGQTTYSVILMILALIVLTCPSRLKS